MIPGNWIDDGGRVIISTPVIQSQKSFMLKAQYARITVCWHYQTVALVGYYGHIPTGIMTRVIKYPVHRLSEFYPYAKLKPKEINCDSDT